MRPLHHHFGVLVTVWASVITEDLEGGGGVVFEKGSDKETDSVHIEVGAEVAQVDFFGFLVWVMGLVGGWGWAWVNSIHYGAPV